MKLIIAYIRPERLRDVKTALAKAEVFRLSIDNVRASGDQPVVHEHYRGADLYVDTYVRVRFEIAVNDDFLDRAIAAISEAAKTDDPADASDGHIIVTDILQAIQIRTGATGGQAIA